MENILHQLERHLARRPTEVAVILGVAYSSYNLMRQDKRPVPEYVQAHIDTLMLIPGGALTEIARRRLTNG